MRKLLLLIILSVFTTTVNSQEICGIVVDDNNHPIFAANVYFVSQPNEGKISNMNGSFSIPFTCEKDTLIVSFIGYETKKILASALNKQSDNIITLNTNQTILSEVIINGATPISEQFSTEKLSRLDIYINPISQADPLKAIINMPSSTNSDESANPSLRGSASNRSRVIYNGVPIYRPVRASSLNNIGFFSIFNPEMVDIQTVYPSNPPLTTGNVSGGIVDLSTVKKINKNKYQFSSGIGNIGFSISQKLKGKSTFIQTYGNWQNSFLLKTINNKSFPDMKKYDTKDAGINFRYTFNNKIYFNSYSYFMTESYKGTSAMLSYQGNLNSDGLRNFSVNNLSYYSKIGMFNLNYGYNYEKKKLLFGNSDLNSEDYSHFASINYKKTIKNNLMLQTGISFDNQNSKVKNNLPLFYYAMNEDSPIYKQDTVVSNYIFEPYFYMSWDINKRISMSIGARSNIPIKQQQYFSFQYSLKYVPIDNHSLIFSAGQYHNYTQPDYFNFKYQLLNSKQVSLDYKYEKEQTKIQSALYYKLEQGERDERDVDFFYTINNSKTFGFELSISRILWNYLTISLSNSTIVQKVNVGGVTYKGSHNFAYFLKPSITYNNPKLFSIGLIYIGRPGSFFLDCPIHSAHYNPKAKAYEPISGELEDTRNGAYNRLDLSMSKYISFKECALTIYLSINNILNTKNETNELYYNMDYSDNYKKYHSLRTCYFGMVFSF